MALFKRKHKVKVTTEKNVITYDELEPEYLNSLIKRRESFEIIAVGGNILKATEMLEKAIESEGLRCRVYTIGRVAVAGLSFAGGVTGLVGVGAVAGIVYHNIFTYNPDYEIGKDLVDNKLEVHCKKTKK